MPIPKPAADATFICRYCGRTETTRHRWRTVVKTTVTGARDIDYAWPVCCSVWMNVRAGCAPDENEFE